MKEVLTVQSVILVLVAEAIIICEVVLLVKTLQGMYLFICVSLIIFSFRNIFSKGMVPLDKILTWMMLLGIWSNIWTNPKNFEFDLKVSNFFYKYSTKHQFSVLCIEDKTFNR